MPSSIQDHDAFDKGSPSQADFPRNDIPPRESCKTVTHEVALIMKGFGSRDRLTIALNSHHYLHSFLSHPLNRETSKSISKITGITPLETSASYSNPRYLCAGIDNRSTDLVTFTLNRFSIGSSRSAMVSTLHP